MANERVIGIDIGTQGTKTALFDLSGNCLAEAFHDSNLKRPAPNAIEEDPEEQYEAVCAGIRDCVEQSSTAGGDVAAIAIDGQMAGVLAVGDDGMAVTPYDSWLDTRCGPYVERMKETAGEEIVRKAGNAPSINHGPKKLWWMHERPEVFKRIRAFVQPGGYAAMRLCGLRGDQAFIDTSYLHFSGFANNRENRWDDALCKEFGFDRNKLPNIVAPHEVVGKVTSDAAARCGVAEGTPVVAGCGDTAASFLAAGATREGVCVDVAGTASVFAATTKEFTPDVEHQTLGFSRSATPGLWHPYAYINGGGMNLEWFRKEIVGRDRSENDSIDFDELNRLAEELGADADLPLFVPHVAGRVCPPEPAIRGAWADLTWSHRIEHLYRALLEAVALEYRTYKRILEGLLPELRLSEIRVTGGGEKSVFWNRIKASALDLSVVQITRSYGAPMGSAMLAAYGAGLVSSLEEASDRWIETGNSYTADPDLRKLYADKHARYEWLVEAMVGLARLDR